MIVVKNDCIAVVGKIRIVESRINNESNIIAILVFRLPKVPYYQILIPIYHVQFHECGSLLMCKKTYSISYLLTYALLAFTFQLMPF